MKKLRLVAIPAFLVALTLSTESCAMKQDCFTQNPGVSLPQRDKVLPNLSTGQAGREIYQAIVEGDAEKVTSMLKADPQLLQTIVRYDERGDFRPEGQDGDLLTFAVAQCDSNMLVTLLQNGMPADGARRGLAITFALLADTPEMAEILLQAGASPDPQKQGGIDVFSEVTSFGQLGGAMMLLRHGLDLDWVDEFGNGHLETAVNMEDFLIAEKLVQAGANPWRVSMGGSMPVHGFARPMAMPNTEQEAAKERLAKKAQTANLLWPPPPQGEVMNNILAGTWPTAQMKQAGMFASPEALADMRKRAKKP